MRKKWKEKDPHGSKLWSQFYMLLFAETYWKKKTKQHNKRTKAEGLQMLLFQAFSCVLCVINQLVNSLFSLSPLGLHHHKTAVSRPSCALPSRLPLRPAG